MSTSVEIVEVCPRDGLQDEAKVVATADKVAIIEAAVAAGIRRIEVASFVNPRRVPQMADAEAVIAALPRADGVSYIGLVLNAKGMDRAERTELDEVNTVIPVTDAFAQANQGMGVLDAVAMAEAVVARARTAGIRSTVTLAVAFGCPFDGLVPAHHIVDLARRLADAGVDELALADTIGCGVPNQTEELTAAVREATGLPIRVHLHDTRGTGLANSIAALRAGAAALDASLAGLGGCPVAKSATGNIATEDLIAMLDRMDIDTGVDVNRLIEASAVVEQVVSHAGNSKISLVGPFPGALLGGSAHH
jgi:hydroxymethylglutaryl-CoA lyase